MPGSPDAFSAALRPVAPTLVIDWIFAYREILILGGWSSADVAVLPSEDGAQPAALSVARLDRPDLRGLGRPADGRTGLVMLCANPLGVDHLRSPAFRPPENLSVPLALSDHLYRLITAPSELAAFLRESPVGWRAAVAEALAGRLGHSIVLDSLVHDPAEDVDAGPEIGLVVESAALYARRYLVVAGWSVIPFEQIPSLAAQELDESASPDNTCRFARDDAARRAGVAATSRLGFVTVLRTDLPGHVLLVAPARPPDSPSRLLRVRIPAPTSIAAHGQLFDWLADVVPRDRFPPPGFMLGALSEAIQESAIAAMFHDLGLDRPLPPDWTALRKRREGARAAVSMIVPLYGDPQLAKHHLEFAARLGRDDVELVLVCDDPAIHARVQSLCAQRVEEIPNLTLVLNPANFGYASANNIGVRASSGEILWFLNADVYVAKPETVDRIVELFAATPDLGVLGFWLEFEDGTVQHCGMTLERIPERGDLLYPAHPYKGLPVGRVARRVGRETRPHELLTGACMALRRTVFAAVGGLPADYVRGDFEDVELCVRCAAEGFGNLLIDGGPIFHLERQSVRFARGTWSRELTTYYNAALFAARWGEYIESRGG